MGVFVRAEDTRRIKPLSAFIRETVGKAISSFLYVGFLIIAFNHRKRGLHDFIASTHAERVPIGFKLWGADGKIRQKKGLR